MAAQLEIKGDKLPNDFKIKINNFDYDDYYSISHNYYLIIKSYPFFFTANFIIFSRIFWGENSPKFHYTKFYLKSLNPICSNIFEEYLVSYWASLVGILHP